jgi:MoaA/NifB/PqqE/SkfB family radical SAM enzyme
MNLILTNFGHRFITEKIKFLNQEQLDNNALTRLLCQVLKEKTIPISSVSDYEEIVNDGYLGVIDQIDVAAIDFRYKTNPLENVSRIIFEFTTQCNFNCAHCRNGSMEKQTETNIDKLKSITDTFHLLNIKRFDFIGGEVSRYGNGWLKLASHINRNGDNTVTLYTNGWWLEAADFEAAGKFYQNDQEYLSDLKQNGVTHVLFSIDGHEECHDQSRKQIGLYQKILASFDRIKQNGIKPRISALIHDVLEMDTVVSFVDIATRIYDLPADMDVKAKMNTLIKDPTNQFSHFIDIGNGAKLRTNRNKIADIPLHLLRCKAFYRPSPSLIIMANGNLSVCPLLDAGQSYGNIHEQDFMDILNNFQDSFAYKLHAGNEISTCLKYLDQDVFGNHFDHLCTIRAIVTLLAKEINSAQPVTPEILLEINRKIAHCSGH